MSIFDIIGSILKPARDIVDEIITSDEEKLQAQAKLKELQNALEVQLLDYESKIAEHKQKVLVAEAQGESGIQRSWRPITMLTFVFIIFNNFVLAPYVAAFGGNVPTLDIPPGMWALLNVGIGGYIASRGVEKVFQIRNGKNGSS